MSKGQVGLCLQASNRNACLAYRLHWIFNVTSGFPIQVVLREVQKTLQHNATPFWFISEGNLKLHANRSTLKTHK